MKKRKLLAVVGLTIITLGIYDIFWLVKTKKELNAKTRVHTPSIWLLFVPLLLFIVSLIALVISVTSTANNISTNTSYSFNTTTSNFNFNSQPTTTSSPSGSAVIFIVLYILAVILWFVLSFYWFLKFSKAINEYTDGKMGKGETFLLLWVLHLFGVLLIQDTFNDMINEGTIPDQPADQPSSDPSPQAPSVQPVNTPAEAPNASAPTPVSIQPTVISPTPQNPSDTGPQPTVVVSPDQPTQPIT